MGHFVYHRRKYLSHRCFCLPFCLFIFIYYCWRPVWGAFSKEVKFCNKYRSSVFIYLRTTCFWTERFVWDTFSSVWLLHVLAASTSHQSYLFIYLFSCTVTKQNVSPKLFNMHLSLAFSPTNTVNVYLSFYENFIYFRASTSNEVRKCFIYNCKGNVLRKILANDQLPWGSLANSRTKLFVSRKSHRRQKKDQIKKYLYTASKYQRWDFPPRGHGNASYKYVLYFYD